MVDSRLPAGKDESGGARASSHSVPAQVRSGQPVLTGAVQSGDVTETSAVLWARADRPARLVAELSSTPSFRDRRRQDVSFVWCGDTAGQGWGINPEFGGMPIYETIRRLEPDFFLHSGDNIYADGRIVTSVPLPDGTTWRNLTTEAKSKVAETLDDFRGNDRYNLIDENLRRLYAEVPVLAQCLDADGSR